MGWVSWSSKRKRNTKTCKSDWHNFMRILFAFALFVFCYDCPYFTSRPFAYYTRAFPRHIWSSRKKWNGHFSNRESGTSRDLGFFVGFEEEEATSKCSFVSARFLLRLKFKVAQTVSLWEGIFRKKKKYKERRKDASSANATQIYSYDAVTVYKFRIKMATKPLNRSSCIPFCQIRKEDVC